MSIFEKSQLDLPINDNILVNGSMDVNQRGFGGGYDKEAYFVDRWVSTGVYGQATLTNVPMSYNHYGVNSSYYLSMVKAGGEGRVDITQRLENPRIYAAKVMTLSFWADGDIETGMMPTWYVSTFNPTDGYNSKFVNGTFEPTGETAEYGWKRYSATFKAVEIRPKDVDFGAFMTINLQFKLTASHGVSAIKLEHGSVATPFIQDLNAVNLAKCQRYYFKDTMSAKNTYYAHPLSDIAQYWGLHLRFPVRMRKEPNVSYGISGFGGEKPQVSIVSGDGLYLQWGATKSGIYGGISGLTADAEF